MGEMKRSLYDTWYGMLRRCYNQKSSKYKYYGAKGVTVEERWHDYKDFVFDIENKMPNGHLLFYKGYQLDKDINGGNIYSLENCVIVPAKENRELARAKQKKKILMINDTQRIVHSSLAETSEVLNIPQQTIYRYLQNGKQHSSGYQFEYYNN